MSYCNDGYLWLLIDDGGKVIGICASEWIANISAKALGVDIERSRNNAIKVGDILPSFHS